MKIVFNQLPKTLLRTSLLEDWLFHLCSHYKVKATRLMFNFITENEMLSINHNFLDHDTHTDIVTFQYADAPIEGEIFISIQRLFENAEKFCETIENEMLRLISHGFLHLVGYNDLNSDQKTVMREQEDLCIKMFHVKHTTNV